MLTLLDWLFPRRIPSAEYTRLALARLRGNAAPRTHDRFAGVPLPVPLADLPATGQPEPLLATWREIMARQVALRYGRHDGRTDDVEVQR